MNKSKGLFLLLFIILLASCNKEDQVYKSISGSWRCEEFNPYTGSRVYMVDIDRSKSDTSVYLLSNFYNLDINEFVYAKLNGSTLIIPDQIIMALRVRSGTGVVAGDFSRIDLEYYVTDGQSDIRIEATYMRTD